MKRLFFNTFKLFILISVCLSINANARLCKVPKKTTGYWVYNCDSQRYKTHLANNKRTAKKQETLIASNSQETSRPTIADWFKKIFRAGDSEIQTDKKLKQKNFKPKQTLFKPTKTPRASTASTPIKNKKRRTKRRKKKQYSLKTKTRSTAITRGRHSLNKLKIKTNDNYSCLPIAVKRQLSAMGKMGWQVYLMSAHRSRRDNARRGGAKGSMHIHCRAADFKVGNVSRKKVERYLRANRIGGLGLYCSGRFHIDNGSRREWGNCSGMSQRSSRRRYRAKKYTRNPRTRSGRKGSRR